MDDNLKDFTDLKLVEPQHAARLHEDPQTADKVLRLTKPRQKTAMEKVTTETLNYVSLREDDESYQLVLQFDGGGVATEIRKSDSSRKVTKKLMGLVHLIEKSIASRAAA